MTESITVAGALAQAIAHHEAERFAEAEQLYRAILAAEPRHSDANHNLGLLGLQHGRVRDALPLLKSALEIDPSQGRYWLTYIEAVLADGAAAEAFQIATQAKQRGLTGTEIDALLAQADRRARANTVFETALAEHQARRLDVAVKLYRDALALDPDFAAAHGNLGSALHELGRLSEAEPNYRRAIALKSDMVEPRINFAGLLISENRFTEAAAMCREAIALRPDSAEAYFNLANALSPLGKPDEAEASYRRVLELKPDSAQTYQNLGNLLSQLLRADEGIECFRTGARIEPDFVAIHTNLLSYLGFGSRHDPASDFADAKRVGAAFDASVGSRRFARNGRNRDPERVLRVGYLSGSLNAHVLTPYLEPVLRAHDRNRVSVHVYAHVPHPDAVTRRLQGLVDSWVFVDAMNDEDVAQRIAGDEIDVLVEPTGHWAENRMRVFAQRPAPIQVSYLCQNLTTGLMTMDYAIGDRWLNLDGGMQAFAVEKVVELDHGFQITSFDDAPEIGSPPCLANGYVTFGYFGNPLKISDQTAVLWGALAARVPTARFLIKGNRTDWAVVRDAISARLGRRGVPADRIQYATLLPDGQFLSYQNKVDIGLDTTPFCGGRTTIDALYMGVPVATLVGKLAYGRYGFSHLSRIGATELIARTPEEYVDIVANLAAEPERLRAYRQTLRPALLRSTLFDYATHTRELEDAFRSMWRTWCAAG